MCLYAISPCTYELNVKKPCQQVPQTSISIYVDYLMGHQRLVSGVGIVGDLARIDINVRCGTASVIRFLG